MNNRKQSRRWLSGLAWVLTSCLTLSAHADPMWTRLKLEQLDRVAAVEGEIPDQGFTHRLTFDGEEGQVKLTKTEALILEELIRVQGKPVPQSDLLIVSHATTAFEVDQAVDKLNAQFTSKYGEPLIGQSVQKAHPFFQVGELDSELTMSINPEPTQAALRMGHEDDTFTYHGETVQVSSRARQIVDHLKRKQNPRTLEEIGQQVNLGPKDVKAAIDEINIASVFSTGVPLIYLDKDGALIDRISLEVPDHRRTVVTLREQTFTLSPKANAVFARYENQVESQPTALKVVLTPKEHLSMSIPDILDALYEVNTLAVHYTGAPVWSQVTIEVPGRKPQPLAKELVWVKDTFKSAHEPGVCAEVIGEPTETTAPAVTVAETTTTEAAATEATVSEQVVEAVEEGQAKVEKASQTVVKNVRERVQELRERAAPATARAQQALTVVSGRASEVGRTAGGWAKRVWNAITYIPDTGE